MPDKILVLSLILWNMTLLFLRVRSTLYDYFFQYIFMFPPPVMSADLGERQHHRTPFFLPQNSDLHGILISKSA